jgi:hypothetical protein
MGIITAKNPWTTREATILSESETTTWTDSDTASRRKFYRIELSQ